MDIIKQPGNLDYAWEMLHSEHHIFLTGPAGSGKSTIIRKFINANIGQVIVMAPTGIAAVNVGGVTIHSFCHFPGRPINKDSIKWLDTRKSSEFAKKAVLERAKYLIIDEVSMDRADLMDQIAWFLEKNLPNRGPFGGIKIVMVGDLDQLPPVMANDEETRMLRARYETEFFFSAKCWKENSFKKVTLTHVFRQSDPTFVNLLNDIKTNRLAPFDLDKLNRTCVRGEGLTPEKDGVMLCSTNEIASEVNNEMVHRLEGEVIRLEGELSGDFNEKNCPVEQIIDLKIGCRVMTMRNDPEGAYFNGSIGKLIGMTERIVITSDNPFDEPTEETLQFLEIKLDNGNKIEVGRVNFETVEYAYDEVLDKIKHKVTGVFKQYPIKIAYALTIHKSQGQTFDKVIIDLGERGAFAHGQVYVALSRCRSLEGLTIRRPIKQKDLIYNPAILEFNKL
jgi:ATP-dependent DNA helicase PIF1